MLTRGDCRWPPAAALAGAPPFCRVGAACTANGATTADAAGQPGGLNGYDSPRSASVGWGGSSSVTCRPLDCWPAAAGPVFGCIVAAPLFTGAEAPERCVRLTV